MRSGVFLIMLGILPNTPIGVNANITGLGDLPNIAS